MIVYFDSSSIELFFSCFDKQLNQAAKKEGFRVHEEFQQSG